MTNATLGVLYARNDERYRVLKPVPLAVERLVVKLSDPAVPDSALDRFHGGQSRLQVHTETTTVPENAAGRSCNHSKYDNVAEAMIVPIVPAREYPFLPYDCGTEGAERTYSRACSTPRESNMTRNLPIAPGSIMRSTAARTAR
jgi:hypothetical protein